MINIELYLNKMFGEIKEETVMPRCACVACNSCTCACSCRNNPSIENNIWEE